MGKWLWAADSLGRGERSEETPTAPSTLPSQAHHRDSPGDPAGGQLERSHWAPGLLDPPPGIRDPGVWVRKDPTGPSWKGPRHLGYARPRRPGQERPGPGGTQARRDPGAQAGNDSDPEGPRQPKQEEPRLLG